MIARNIRLAEAYLLTTPGYSPGDARKAACMSGAQWYQYRANRGSLPGVGVQLRITNALGIPEGALLWGAVELVTWLEPSALDSPPH